MMTRSIEGGARLPVIDVAEQAVLDTRLDEAVALRRCALHRKAFRGMAVSCPAGPLRRDAVAGWIRRHGVTVDAASVEELELIAAAGIDASRVVFHCGGASLDTIRRVVHTPVARFVVDGSKQVGALAEGSTMTKRVLIDASSADLAAAVTAHRSLDLVGLHHRCTESEGAEPAEVVSPMIARMSWITREHGVLLSRLSIGEVDVTGCDGDPRRLRRVAEAVDQAVEDGCIRWRYPRPAVALSLRAPR